MKRRPPPPPIAAIVERDPDDENDYPETNAEWSLWLRLQLARQVTKSDLDVLRGVLARNVVLTADVGLRVDARRPTMPDDDPGDTDHSYVVRRVDVGPDGKITAKVE